VLAVFMVVGTAVVLANLTIDLVYAVLDPRIRYV
jgi:ABC-type dipeptide/oligopeptide/nickel transport system permease component